MSSYRLSSRYAKALIQLAQEKGQLEEASKDILSVDNAFENSSEMRVLFRSPIIPTDKKLAIAQKLFDGKLSPLVYQFILLLIKKGRESHLHEVVNSFVTQYNVIKGITPVKISTAVKLDAAIVDSLIAGLKREEKLDVIDLTQEVDESLIGGFVLRYSDKMIDSSVKRKFKELKTIVEDNSYIKKY